MNPILPTGAALPQAPVAPVGQILATLTQLPQLSLNNLLVGAFLSGTVLGRDNKGQILLQTGQGVFGIKTNSPLQIGSIVTFEVQSAGAQLQTVLLSVTAPNARPHGAPIPAVIGPPVGEPMAPPAPGAPSQHGPQTTANSAQPATTTTTTPQGATVTATVIAPPGGHAPPPPTPATPQMPVASAPTGATMTPAAPLPTLTPATTNSSVDLPGSTAVFARVPTQAAPGLLQAAVAPHPVATPGSPTATTQVMTAAAEPAATQAAGASAVRAPAFPTQTPSTLVPAGAPLATTEPAPLQALPTGTQVQVRVLPNPPSAPNAPPGLVLGNPANMGSPAPTVPAAIVGRTPQGQTIVETPIGRLAMTLPPTQEAVPGKLLTLELSVITRPASPEPPPLAQRHSAMSITHEWPALKAAVAAAEDGPDHILKIALDEAVPRPGPRLAQQLLQAVAGGDTRQALTESVVKPLERAGLHEMAQRIQSDLQDLQKLGSTPSADWRLAFVPFFDGQDVRQLRIFTRKNKKNETARKGEAGTRFVIECEHGELGELQLDGFLQKQSLDVIVRSHTDLPAWMKGDMIALFTDSCGAIGMTGRLQFNTAPAFPVAPMDEIAGSGAGVLV